MSAFLFRPCFSVEDCISHALDRSRYRPSEFHGPSLVGSWYVIHSVIVPLSKMLLSPNLYHYCCLFSGQSSWPMGCSPFWTHPKRRLVSRALANYCKVFWWSTQSMRHQLDHIRG